MLSCGRVGSLWFWLSNCLVLHSYFEQDIRDFHSSWRHREVLNLSSWCLELLHPCIVFKQDQFPVTRGRTQSSVRQPTSFPGSFPFPGPDWEREKSLGTRLTWNICKVFDEFRQVFDPDLDNTALRDLINQVDKVLSNITSDKNLSHLTLLHFVSKNCYILP